MSTLKLVLDLIGYVGSAFVVIALMQTNMRRLRVLNAIGSAISAAILLLTAQFIAGDIMTVSWPVVLLNALLVVVNVVMLIKMRVEKADK